MRQLQLFAVRALRQLPTTALWWVLATLAGATLVLLSHQEVFPNTPAVVGVAVWALGAAGLALPLLGVWWLWRVAAMVEHAGWRLLWYLVATGGTLLLGLALLGLLWLLTGAAGC